MIHTEYCEESKILYGMIAIHIAEIDVTEGDPIELDAIVDNKIRRMRDAVMEKIDEYNEANS